MAPSGRILVTGFGPFLDVVDNPSGATALRFDGRTFDGATVRSAVLPVSVARVPGELAGLVDEHDPVAIVATGVHRQPWWRVERRACVPLTATKPDVDGAVPSEATAALARRELATTLDAAGVAAALSARGLDARTSDDAGGYVCEWTYHAALAHGERLAIPVLFVHVPPAGSCDDEERDRALDAVLRFVVAALPG